MFQADKTYRVLSAEHTPELRWRLTRELAQRLCWSSLAYALFATLVSLNLAPRVRGAALLLSAVLAVLGGLRSAYALQVMRGRGIERDGKRMIRIAGTLSIVFGGYVAFAEYW